MQALATLSSRTRAALGTAAVAVALSVPGFAQAAVQFVAASSATTGTGSGSTLTIVTPAGAAAGQVLVAVITARGQMSTFDPLNPAAPTWTGSGGGWVVVSNVARNNQLFQVVLARRLNAAPAASYSFQVTFDQATTVRLAGTVLAYSGVGSIAPFDASANANDPACTAGAWSGTGITQYNSTAWTATPCQASGYRVKAYELMTLGSGAALVGAFVHGYSSTSVNQTWTGPAGMAVRGQVENKSGVRGLAQLVTDQINPPLGLTGDRVAAPAQTGGVVHSIGQLMLLCPSSAACGAP